MDHFQVKVRKVDEPAGLSSVEVLGGTEVGEVFVVGEDLDRERGSMEVVSPRLQGADDGEEFSVVNVIVSLSWGERLREVGTWVPFAVGVGLEKDGAGSILRGVSSDSEGCGGVGEV